MTVTPTELELRVLRALRDHPYYPARALATAAGDTVANVRSALAELRRFELVCGTRRGLNADSSLYALTPAGEAILVDSLRLRSLAVRAAA
jgi:hypothetical protein